MYVELEQNMLAWAGLYADFVSAADARVFKAADTTMPDKVEPPVRLMSAEKAPSDGSAGRNRCVDFGSTPSMCTNLAPPLRARPIPYISCSKASFVSSYAISPLVTETSTADPVECAPGCSLAASIEC